MKDNAITAPYPKQSLMNLPNDFIYSVAWNQNFEVLDNFLESFKIIHKNYKHEIRQQNKIKKVAFKTVEEKSAIVPNKRGRKKKIIEDTRSEEQTCGHLIQNLEMLVA